MIDAGDLAPDFQLPADDGSTVRLSDLRGRNVVLYFYPKADTPGCTTQACDLRDRHDLFDVAGATVLGISPDPADEVRAFHRKFDLNFRLLADEDHAVAERYGVWKLKSMFGKEYWGVERTTFVVDPEGRVGSVFRKVNPETHAAEVLQAL